MWAKVKEQMRVNPMLFKSEGIRISEVVTKVILRQKYWAPEALSVLRLISEEISQFDLSIFLS